MDRQQSGTTSDFLTTQVEEARIWQTVLRCSSVHPP